MSIWPMGKSCLFLHFSLTIISLCRLLKSPLEWLPSLELALKEVASTLNDPSYDYDLTKVQLHVGFEGSFGALHTTPRHLSASLLNHLVCLDGIATSCSLVRPKLLRSVHFDEQSRSFKMREYFDATMITANAQVSSMNYPTGGEGERLISEFGLSSYRDYQTISIQEMPEKAPAGQLPRSVDVVMDDDLVDAVKPGDRIQIVGVFKTITNASGGVIPAAIRTVVVANNVRVMNAESQCPTLSADDHHNIRAVSKRRDVFELLSRSLAPSIYGHAWVKKAVLLMLLGGVEKNLPNGTHLRGDINLMLVGDPSTAKSQMLRFVLNLAPLAIATTGRGSSGVGLTAAVTTDRETGERRLEAGAMVLADRGIVCIDEFDKMSDIDRVAIHEVMEQQTVTIAKAGIHTSLNARCSVLAAANPIWGQYRETASPQENIRLPDSLLSRFDLLFIILDTSNPDDDLRISRHVLKMHRFIPPGLHEGQPIDENAANRMLNSDDEEGAMDASVNSSTAVFQKHYAQNTNASEAADEDEEDTEILTIPFLKKYIHYARSRITPVLTKAATDHIVAAYAEFRQKRDASESGVTEARTFPVTPRTLETLIRLATAHAKARLSSRVEKKDAKVAQELLQFCLYKEVKKKLSKRARKAAAAVATSSSDDEGDEPEESDNDDDGASTVKKTPTPLETTANVVVVENAGMEMGGLSLEEGSFSAFDKNTPTVATQMPATQETIQASTATTTADETGGDSLNGFVDASQGFTQDSLPTKPTAQEEQMVRSAVNHLRQSTTGISFPVSSVRGAIRQLDAAQGAIIPDTIIRQVLQAMNDANQIFLSDDNIYIM